MRCADFVNVFCYDGFESGNQCTNGFWLWSGAVFRRGDRPVAPTSTGAFYFPEYFLLLTFSLLPVKNKKELLT